MKFLLIISVFLLSSMYASSLKTIRIGSYVYKSDAKDAYEKLQRELQNSPKLRALQEQEGFYFKYRASGKYFITLAEPFKSKKITSEVLRIIKRKYPDAYVTKISQDYLEALQKGQLPSSEQAPSTNAQIEDLQKRSKDHTQSVTDETTTDETIQPSLPQESIEEDTQEVAPVSQSDDMSLPTIQESQDMIAPQEVSSKQTAPTSESQSKQEDDMVVKKEDASQDFTILQPQNNDKVSSIQTTIQEYKDKFLSLFHGIHIPTLGGSLATLLFPILFGIVILGLLALVWFYKRKAAQYETQKLISEERYGQLLEETQNKEQLISYVSHELRSPMTAINGLTSLLQESELKPLQKEYIDKIEKTSSYMMGLLNDILDLSKIQAGKLTIEQAEFNINDIVNYVYNIIAVQAKNNNIFINVNVEKDVPSHVVGDSLRLGQVLINLAGNAIKFTKDGEVSINVKKLESFANSVTLEFRVADTGIGMTQDQVDKLFNMYYQADASTSREYGGTGLGLSISKMLVEMMKGTIRVESQKDVGTTFIFTAHFALKDSQNKRQYRLPTAKLMNKSVLVVDSHNKNAIPLMQAFSYFRYKTHNILSFEESEINLDEERFDIIVIGLDNLNERSINILENVRKKHGTKIVILSELQSGLNDTLLKKIQVDGYVKLPITIQSILNFITELYIPKQSIAPKKKKSLKEKLAKYKGKKIVVAEDNELNHKVIAGMLTGTGIEVTFVYNGYEVLDILHNGAKVDLILMDINMPKLNGYETALKIREEAQYDRIPILALSADVTKEAVKKSYKSGMQGHISKPISGDQFYNKVSEAFDAKYVQMKHKVSKEEFEKEDKSYKDEDLVVSVGLSHCHNDEAMYKELLEEFKVMYRDSASKLYELCQKGEFKKARHVAMDVKDIALNIGAYQVVECSAAMEYEFEKGSRGNWKEHIQNYHTKLKELFVAVDNYLQKG